jgi:hypothetical protein
MLNLENKLLLLRPSNNKDKKANYFSHQLKTKNIILSVLPL